MVRRTLYEIHYLRLTWSSGSLQFASLLFLNILTILFDQLRQVMAGGDLASAFVYINEAIASILISHFILDLRGVYLGDGDEWDENTSISLNFGDSVIGNLGAPLDSAWVEGQSGKERNTEEEDESIKFSRNPLSVGLLDGSRFTDSATLVDRDRNATRSSS
ncbi:hypothetical protein QCA50_019842 [Cerrena zonata]|uniref:Uncharacterized protein n=1 Tax=Cerrena zonata TaxID=2478898 RepID=A0AAW0FHR1_9APHY